MPDQIIIRFVPRAQLNGQRGILLVEEQSEILGGSVYLIMGYIKEVTVNRE